MTKQDKMGSILVIVIGENVSPSKLEITGVKKMAPMMIPPMMIPPMKQTRSVDRMVMALARRGVIRLAEVIV